MSELEPKLYADLIGVPFVDGGRALAGLDCWGLLQVVLRRMGHDPTDFPSDPRILTQALSDEWQPVERDAVELGDGILLRSVNPRYVWHVGVVVGPGRFLHAHEGAGCCIERFDGLKHARRVAGFYRYRGRPIDTSGISK